MTVIEMGYALAQRGAVSFMSDDEVVDVPVSDATTVQTHRVSEATATVDCGVRYQRCGGGRRVIRKQIGGN